MKKYKLVFIISLLSACQASIDNEKGIIIKRYETWDGRWKYWGIPVKGEPRTIYFLDDEYKFKLNDTVYFINK